MKKALIIIAAVFVGFAGLAVVGSMLPEDEQVVIVDPTQTPALTASEQDVFEFVAVNYPKAQELFENTCAVTDGEISGDGLAEIEQIVSDASDFADIARPWADLDYEGGEVAALEDAFETYMTAIRAYYTNWLKGIDGQNVSACAARAVRAEVKAEAWGPRVEDELAAVEDKTSY